MKAIDAIKEILDARDDMRVTLSVITEKSTEEIVKIEYDHDAREIVIHTKDVLHNEKEVAAVVKDAVIEALENVEA